MVPNIQDPASNLVKRLLEGFSGVYMAPSSGLLQRFSASWDDTISLMIVFLLSSMRFHCFICVSRTVIGHISCIRI